MTFEQFQHEFRAGDRFIYQDAFVTNRMTYLGECFVYFGRRMLYIHVDNSSPGWYSFEDIVEYTTPIGKNE